jgi:hypothetical protein
MDVVPQLRRSRLAPFGPVGARPGRRSCESSGFTERVAAGPGEQCDCVARRLSHTAYADSLRDDHIRRVTWER